MKRYLVLIGILSMLGAWATTVSAQPEADVKRLLQKVTVLTCIEPPYQMEQPDGSLTGISVELVQLVLKEAQVDAEIHVYPWARAYRMAQTQENVMLFSILRNPPRENLFKWVGALHPFHVSFYRLKSRPEIVVKTLGDAKKYKIGTLKDDSRDIYLRSQGFDEKNLEEAPFDDNNIRKLFGGRIELLPSDPFVLAYWFKVVNEKSTDKQVFSLSQVEPIFRLGGADGDNYIAMSPQTDERVVKHFHQALERVRARPQYQQLLDKYLGIRSTNQRN